MTFRFTISALGTFLGKSPVTIRAWERKGLVKLPRVGANRALSITEVRRVAQVALDAGRISRDRFSLITEALSALTFIEQENE